MACPANSRETKIGVGSVQQTDLATPNTAAQLWSFLMTNTSPFVITPNTEDDALDIGKGDEFPTQVFPVSMDVTGRIEKQISSQFAAWAFAFGLGSYIKAVEPTGGTRYTCFPTDPLTDCIDLPPFTAVEQIRPSGTPPFTDRMMVGCVITGFTVSLESGPGRNSARIAVDMAGTGKVVSPTGTPPIVIPAPTPEVYLSASSASISVGGIDYVLSKSFISAEVTWGVSPRLDTGYYPGSGVDANGYAIRGRMEYSQRVAGMTFVARAQAGSPEYNALISRVPGPVVIILTGPVIGAGPGKHSIEMHFPHAVISAVVNGDADGLVTVNCTVKPLKHATGYCAFVAVTNKADITLNLSHHAAREMEEDGDRDRDREEGGDDRIAA